MRLDARWHAAHNLHVNHLNNETEMQNTDELTEKLKRLFHYGW